MPHLYVHIPFCRRRCSYCDFSIAVRKAIPSARYVDAVLEERDLRTASETDVRGSFATLYLGGGTPSLLAADQLARLVAAFGLEHDAEVTLEANPDDVTLDAARAWHAAGINRVSLGAQSFHAAVLAWMHRTHTAEQTARAVASLREAGIGSVSLDLIFALPAELAYDFRRDLDQALALEPQHVSVYGLSVEPRTPLARWIARGSTTPGTDERYADEFLLADRVLTDAGFEHYEVSNYAKPGHRARHNGAYWTGARYVGLGPSAHGFNGTVRRWNISAWTEYERRVAAGTDPIDGSETLASDQRALEDLYLGLRTADGVDATSPGLAAATVDRALAEGWLTRTAGRLLPTPQGWLRLDALLPVLTT